MIIAMSNNLFRNTLQRAVAGDLAAQDEILRLYEPLINHHSFVDGAFDEDCRQYIMLRIIAQLPKFTILE